MLTLSGIMRPGVPYTVAVREEMRGQSRYWLVAIILLGALVRWPSLFANTFHADEALFGSWARLIGVWRDPLLSSQLVDKPPLLFYLQALFFPILGTPAPWVARLPNFIASLLLVPLTAQLAWRLYQTWLPALAAALFIALSPYTVQFSATAFTDPLLTVLLASSLLAAVAGGRQRRALWAGLLFGLALATKHQALLFAPLLLAAGWMHGWSRARWARWLAGVLGPVLAVLLWDAARDAPSLWAVQGQNYGGLRLAWSWELWPRLEEWARWWQIMFGSQVLGFALLLALPVFLALLIYDRDWSTAYDQLILLYVLAYAGLHWFLTVPVWDRYLLPLAPLVALLLGRFGTRVIAFVGPNFGSERRVEAVRVLALLFLFGLLLPAGWAARRGAFPVGGFPEADSGAARIAAVLYDAPYGTVLYDHWYGWQWRYYFFDRRVLAYWFAGPDTLAEDLEAFGSHGTRYLVLPEGEVGLPAFRAATAAGFQPAPLYAAGTMVLYRLDPLEP
jgi:4-amino-4-deoxy-L-arabinose transferase-like glycosyltransferase